MKEYIERTAALDICQKEYEERLRMADYCGDTVAWNIGGAIKSIPAADVAEVRHGRWNSNGIALVCSECGRAFGIVEMFAHYCPWCGAVNSAPTIDAVRAAGGCYCQECKYADYPIGPNILCKKFYGAGSIDGFCYWGQRKEDEHEAR